MCANIYIIELYKHVWPSGSKAFDLSSNPQGRGFEPHCVHFFRCESLKKKYVNETINNKMNIIRTLTGHHRHRHNNRFGANVVRGSRGQRPRTMKRMPKGLGDGNPIPSSLIAEYAGTIPLGVSREFDRTISARTVLEITVQGRNFTPENRGEKLGSLTRILGEQDFFPNLHTLYFANLNNMDTLLNMDDVRSMATSLDKRHSVHSLYLAYVRTAYANQLIPPVTPSLKKLVLENPILETDFDNYEVRDILNRLYTNKQAAHDAALAASRAVSVPLTVFAAGAGAGAAGAGRYLGDRESGSSAYAERERPVRDRSDRDRDREELSSVRTRAVSAPLKARRYNDLESLSLLGMSLNFDIQDSIMNFASTLNELELDFEMDLSLDAPAVLDVSWSKWADFFKALTTSTNHSVKTICLRNLSLPRLLFNPGRTNVELSTAFHAQAEGAVQELTEEEQRDLIRTNMLRMAEAGEGDSILARLFSDARVKSIDISDNNFFCETTDGTLGDDLPYWTYQTQLLAKLITSSVHVHTINLKGTDWFQGDNDDLLVGPLQRMVLDALAGNPNITSVTLGSEFNALFDDVSLLHLLARPHLKYVEIEARSSNFTEERNTPGFREQMIREWWSQPRVRGSQLKIIEIVGVDDNEMKRTEVHVF